MGNVETATLRFVFALSQSSAAVSSTALMAWASADGRSMTCPSEALLADMTAVDDREQPRRSLADVMDIGIALGCS